MTVQRWLIDQTVRQFNTAISKRHQIFYEKKFNGIKRHQIFYEKKFNGIKSNNKSFIFNTLKYTPELSLIGIKARKGIYLFKYWFINLQITVIFAQY